MDADHRPFDNHGLLHAALEGDAASVQRALGAGADINALDSMGRTVLMCAVAGENWQQRDASDASFLTSGRLDALSLLLRHPDITLLTLNFPHKAMNGVTPLGLAAWLNMPDVVRLLLEVSLGTVSVDGMDSHGTTALMYAARDGSLEVVQRLLSHGARPDFRDCNHRTSIQFALAHPQILWMCEVILRRHRRQENLSVDRRKLNSECDDLLQLMSASLSISDDLTPPPLSIFTPKASSRLTDTIISSICLPDVQFLHSLLFSPPIPASSPAPLYPMSVPCLINNPDEKGWSPIHYCGSVEHPSLQILDTLYCAGADVTLFTAREQQTLLHILAKRAHVPPNRPRVLAELHDFIVHLVCDLRAPLAARDKEGETCLHYAAEHGRCIEMIVILLDCDPTGQARKLKNARGLTPFDVAKPEFRAAFGRGKNARPDSSLSNHTIRPTESFTSLISFSEWNSAPETSNNDASFLNPSDMDINALTHKMLSSLRFTSPSLSHIPDTAHLRRLDVALGDAGQLGLKVVQHFRSRVEEAARDVGDLRDTWTLIETLRLNVAHAAMEKMIMLGIVPMTLKKKHRESEDSQNTAVARESTDGSGTCAGSLVSLRYQFPTSEDIKEDKHSSFRASTRRRAVSASSGSLMKAANGISGTTRHPGEASTPAQKIPLLNDLWEVERQLVEHHAHAATEAAEGLEADPADLIKVEQLVKQRQYIEECLYKLEGNRKVVNKKENSTVSGAAKFKAWFKRIIAAPEERQRRVSFSQPKLLDVEGEGTYIGAKKQNTVPVFRFTVSNSQQPPSPYPGIFIAEVLRTSPILLDSVQRDLKLIGECLSSVEQCIETVRHSISRAERVIKRALHKRENMVAKLRLPPRASKNKQCATDHLNPGLLGVHHLSVSPSMASISSTHSIVSIAATVIENDDEDTRVIRRLVLRKIDLQTSSAWDEIDKIIGWLRVVKEVVRGVKRQAYL